MFFFVSDGKFDNSMGVRKRLFSSLEFAPNNHFILVSDGIDKKLQNKKLELRQNIIENSTNHEVKPCFK